MIDWRTCGGYCYKTLAAETVGFYGEKIPFACCEVVGVDGFKSGEPFWWHTNEKKRVLRELCL